MAAFQTQYQNKHMRPDTPDKSELVRVLVDSLDAVNAANARLQAAASNAASFHQRLQELGAGRPSITTSSQGASDRPVVGKARIDMDIEGLEARLQRMRTIRGDLELLSELEHELGLLREESEGAQVAVQHAVAEAEKNIELFWRSSTQTQSEANATLVTTLDAIPRTFTNALANLTGSRDEELRAIEASALKVEQRCVGVIEAKRKEYGRLSSESQKLDSYDPALENVDAQRQALRDDVDVLRSKVMKARTVLSDAKVQWRATAASSSAEEESAPETINVDDIPLLTKEVNEAPIRGTEQTVNHSRRGRGTVGSKRIRDVAEADEEEEEQADGDALDATTVSSNVERSNSGSIMGMVSRAASWWWENKMSPVDASDFPSPAEEQDDQPEPYPSPKSVLSPIADQMAPMAAAVDDAVKDELDERPLPPPRVSSIPSRNEQLSRSSTGGYEGDRSDGLDVPPRAAARRESQRFSASSGDVIPMARQHDQDSVWGHAEERRRLLPHHSTTMPNPGVMSQRHTVLERARQEKRDSRRVDYANSQLHRTQHRSPTSPPSVREEMAASNEGPEEPPHRQADVEGKAEDRWF